MFGVPEEKANLFTLIDILLECRFIVHTLGLIRPELHVHAEYVFLLWILRWSDTLATEDTVNHSRNACKKRKKRKKKSLVFMIWRVEPNI
jgi:hypothetical protein